MEPAVGQSHARAQLCGAAISVGDEDRAESNSPQSGARKSIDRSRIEAAKAQSLLFKSG